MASKILCVVTLVAVCLIQGHGANPLLSGIKDLVSSSAGAVASAVGDGVNLADQLTEQTARFDVNSDEPKSESDKALQKQLDDLVDLAKDTSIDAKEHAMRVAEAIREVRSKINENLKSRLENIKSIAREFAQHTQGVGKEVIKEFGEEILNVTRIATDYVNEVRSLNDGAFVPLNLG